MISFINHRHCVQNLFHTNINFGNLKHFTETKLQMFYITAIIHLIIKAYLSMVYLIFITKSILVVIEELFHLKLLLIYLITQNEIF